MSLGLPSTLTWGELLRRTWRESMDDDILGLAAQLAYYFFLALFPALLFGLALASFFPLASLTDDLGQILGPFVSADMLQLIQGQMRRLANADSGGLLTLGAAGALWSSSSALVSIVDALNRAYDLQETRPWWKVRLTALGLTVGLSIFILVALSLVLAGPTVAEALGRRTGLGSTFEWTWLIVQWPVALGLVALAIGLVYYFGPDAEQAWSWITPGALVATVAWLLVSLAFKLYVANFTDYNASYGAIGGVIVLMLWLYVSSIALLVGAELNSEIEHASAEGKAPGQKTQPNPATAGAQPAQGLAPAPDAAARGPEAPSADAPGVRLLPGTALAAVVVAARSFRRAGDPSHG